MKDVRILCGRTGDVSGLVTDAWSWGSSVGGGVKSECWSAPTAPPDKAPPRMKPARPQIGPLDLSMVQPCQRTATRPVAHGKVKNLDVSRPARTNRAPLS